MPIAARRSAGTDACVIVAGWEMSVSTPPRLSASASSRTLLSSRRAASSDPRSNDEHAAEARASAAAPARAADASAGPGSRRAAPSDAPPGTRASARPFALCCCHPQRQRLGAAQHQPRIERAEDRARRVLHEPQPLDVVVARRRRRRRRRCRCGRSGTSSCCAATRSAPNSIGRWTYGARERVVDDQPHAVAVRERRPRRAGRSAAAPGWSASRRTASASPA